MIARKISYRSFCWSIGTTSFRTKDFNFRIERQLQILDDFWRWPENENEKWSNNSKLQERYYCYLKERGFVEGDAARKDKDAREKTSGLVDIGLLNDERRLTEVGEALLKISLSSDYTPDNSLQLDKDSYIYLKQMLKTYAVVNGNVVRPFVVLSYLLCSLGRLAKDEFTYLLPLCITHEHTLRIEAAMRERRKSGGGVDRIIIETLMNMENYKQALLELIANEVDEDLICAIGLNRKSRKYDKPYYRLYNELKRLFVQKDTANTINVYNAIESLKIKSLWRKYLFSNHSLKAIERT